MASVREVLDGLVSGKLTLAQAVNDFESRSWPARAEATDAQVWGVVDDEPEPADSWATVDADSRLTTDQYGELAAAYGRAISGG